MKDPSTLMPDGSRFPSWDDRTRYTRTYHVACRHPQASDANDGTEVMPFATIARAAEILQPGEKVIVHEGTYRECVRPGRGGAGPEAMIAYEAAEGEEVWIKGSEEWAPAFAPSAGYTVCRKPSTPRLWMADLPERFFAGYNPFMARNINMHYITFDDGWTKEETARFLLRRGMIFANGRRLREVLHIEDLTREEDAYWVEEPGLRIHLRLAEDAEPSTVSFEVTAREQVFAPQARGLGYVRVSGFRMAHAADNIPVPQRALLSAARGHHWIIENNEISWANGCGIDLGTQDFTSAHYRPRGGHVVRGNRIADCGICGIAGAGCVDDTLVAGNIIERIGWRNLQRLWESAGLKFHVAERVVILGNVFRHIRHACGIWLDVDNRNCRISGNVFADITGIQAGVYVECSHDRNLVDGNLFWDIRCPPPDERPGGGPWGAYGVRGDCPENLTVAHNLFARLPDGWAISMNLIQAERIITDRHGHGGRAGICGRNSVFNNILVGCPQRVVFDRMHENVADGNLYHAGDDQGSLRVSHPQPAMLLNLEGWQTHLGLDRSGAQRRLSVGFDPDTLELNLAVEGDLPKPAPVPELGKGEYAGAGPFGPGDWQKSPTGHTVKKTFPAGPLSRQV